MNWPHSYSSHRRYVGARSKVTPLRFFLGALVIAVFAGEVLVTAAEMLGVRFGA